MTLVVIASQNPAKVQAVKNAFSICFPHTGADKVRFEEFDIQSGIAHPNSIKETYRSAEYRLVGLLGQCHDADFYVVLESGIEERSMAVPYLWKQRLFNFGLVIVRNAHGPFFGYCESIRFPVPRGIADIMDQEHVGFGEASDMFFNKRSLKRGEGTVGILTHDKITRTKMFLDPAIFALNQAAYPAHWL